VAVVDTGAQTDHPDLRGRAIRLENLVDDTAPAGGTSPATWAERHGTEVVGLIAATANNAQGIVGVAPDARISLYRACWSGTGPGAARCNSYTLAKALVAVLASDARNVNLSLGGPEDPLLGLLLAQLLQQGRTVVAALPQDGRRRGFPSAVPGVIAVASTGQPLAGDTQALRAPGQDVLTLQPGGRYDFASGSSMAAAQVSGLAALLLAMQPSLAHSDIEALLQGEDHGSAERLLTRAKAQPARQARR
jgi:subtilisin family serine protease